MSANPPAAYASLGGRVAAYLIDSVILSAGMALCYALQVAGIMNGSSMLLVIAMVATVAIAVGYPIFYIALQGRVGMTPGKRVVGLRTVDVETGEPIGFGRAFLRQLILGVLGPVNLVQLLTIPKHLRHQGWHDSAARSVVVRLGLVPVASPKDGGRTDDAASLPGPRSATPPQSTGLGSFAPPPAPPGTPESTPSTRPPRPAPVTPPPAQVAPPPGLPPVAVQISNDVASSGSGVIAPPPRANVPDHGVTTTEPRFGAWVLSTATERKTVIGHLLVGRDPAGTLVGGASTWRLEDPGLSVSKTHALFGADADDLWIEDWHSTNGTHLHRAGEVRRLSPHDRTDLRVGDRIELGDVSVSVTKDPA